MSSLGETPTRQRRKRRTREDVVERIQDAARQLFAERGYAATTTKEIARVADVSETLLFRYYGGKASLFDEVVSAPFNRLMQEFVARHSDRTAEATRKADVRHFVAQVFHLFDRNREMFAAFVATPGRPGEEAVPAPLHGLEGFFRQSVAQQEREFTERGLVPDIDLGIAVRLGFGMIASGVLLRDWLFPAGAPPEESVIEVLERMIERALGPRIPD